jgi:hypothetical protein
VIIRKQINASTADIWRLVSDFGNIHIIYPYVIATEILSEKSSGIGAIRRCDMNDNTYVEEEIINWVKERELTVKQLYFHVVKESEISVKLKPISSVISEISFILRYIRKDDIFGWLEKQITFKWFMKRVFRSIIRNIEKTVSASLS